MAEEYKIEGMTERTRIDPAGKFYRVWEITYVTKSGVRGTVEIPKKEFSKKKAAEIVKKEAVEIEETLRA
ncbi:MAG: hypothetical protein JRE40_03340 [Deltaproteobacteria bacterium]|nr:hypothetical protein [Deltaproteobacteria bacterium]MBW2672978.1 hypothetical protein [Deltaproteobacteria bacterium]